MSKAYLISEQLLNEEILERLENDIQEFQEDYEGFSAMYEKDNLEIPDNVYNYKCAADMLIEIRDILLALPVVETIVIKE